MTTVKMRGGDYMVPVDIEDEGDQYALSFRYNYELKEHLKALKGTRWRPEDKSWTVPKIPSNEFQLRFLQEGFKVYERWNKPLQSFEGLDPSAYAHQQEFFNFMLTRQYCIIAGEMGTGKTMPAIKVMEYVKPVDVWYIAPKATLAAIELELIKWKAKVWPKLMTYEGLTKTMKEWPGGLAPQMVIGDEISKCKGHRTQRTQAMQALADGIRKDWGDRGYVILMSGSPAPKSPSDWWSLCNIAAPGFLKETDFHKFERRLSITKEMEGNDGVKFNKVLAWKDNVNRCASCGKMKEEYIHTLEGIAVDSDGHEFIPCVNEVEKLHRRMAGLVHVKFKKDCLDLPEKVYRTIKVKASLQTIHAAKLLASTLTGANLLMKLRELSDGFQYQTIRGPKVTCPRCNGEREIEQVTEEGGFEFGASGDTHVVPEKREKVPCHACDGSGQVHKEVQQHIPIECPKDKAVLDLLEEFEDDGRLVFYGGFTPTIDRLVDLCKNSGWHYIRVDGRGWDSSFMHSGRTHLLEIFQDREMYDKVAFIGHPGSAGMGLTLTASQAIVYYSNDFNAEYRIQSEDRIHRPGSRGANIIDIIHLPTDLKVLNSLKAKRELQSISLGELQAALEDEQHVQHSDSSRS